MLQPWKLRTAVGRGAQSVSGAGIQNVHAGLSLVRAFRIIPYWHGRSLQARGPLAARDTVYFAHTDVQNGERWFNCFFRKSQGRTPKQFLKLLNCLCMETYVTLLISCVKMY